MPQKVQNVLYKLYKYSNIQELCTQKILADQLAYTCNTEGCCIANYILGLDVP
jgi:hypothetical protein